VLNAVKFGSRPLLECCAVMLPIGELRGQVVHRIIEMNVKVASDDEFMRGGSSEREEGMEVLKKNRVWFRKWR